MMEFFNSIFHFLSNPKYSLSKKATIAIFILFGLLFLNHYLRISFNYNTNSKLDQIEQIENIKKNYQLSEDVLSELNRLESEVIFRDDWFKLLYKSTDSLYLKVRPRVSRPAMPQYTFKPSGRNFLLDLISSSFISIVLIVIMLITPFYNRDKFWVAFAGALVFVLISLVLAWSFFILLSKIPTLAYPLVNYLLNLLINIIFGVLMWKLIDYINKKQ